MALVTTCPHCRTSFRIVADQLKLRNGLVRCGFCLAVFSGLEQMQRLDESATASGGGSPAWSTDDRRTAAGAPHPAARGTAHDDRGPAGDWDDEGLLPDEIEQRRALPALPDFDDDALSVDKPAAAPGEPPIIGEPAVDADEPPIAGMRPSETDEPSTGTMPRWRSDDDGLAIGGNSLAPDEGAAVDHTARTPRHSAIDHKVGEHGAEAATRHPAIAGTAIGGSAIGSGAAGDLAMGSSFAARDRPAIVDDTLLPAPRIDETASGIDEAADDGEMAIDYFSTDERRRGFVGPHAIWKLCATGVLLLMLALQALLTNRDWLAARFPALEPAIAMIATPFGMPIAPPRVLDALSIESFELQTDSVSELLSASAIIHNSARHAVRWPSMMLTLTDAQNRVLVRKAIDPGDYLGNASDRALRPNSERPIRLALEARDFQPAGYSVELFYR